MMDDRRKDYDEEGIDEADSLSLVEHMEKKYLCEHEVEPFINIFGTSPCKLASEKALELLVLDRKSIEVVGDEQKFRRFVRNVSELDLARNKITKWSVVATLLDSLPSLRRLNLAHNPLEASISCVLPESPRLSTLVLNGVNLPLKSLKAFISKLPALNELHLSENNFEDLSQLIGTGEVVSRQVEVLHMNACGFVEWPTIIQVLSLFPQVTTLYLVENEIESVDRVCPHTNLTTEEVSKAIRSLALSECQINSWDAIENLRFVGKLEELRLRDIPLFEPYTNEERHHLVVGRLRQLKQFNGSNISAFQREESERFFIRYYLNSEEKPAVFQELIKEHGLLEQLVKVDLTPQKFAKVMMRCEETNYLAPARIRLNCTVFGLMRYAAKITGISSSRMRLFYFDVTSAASGPMELRFGNQVLSSLHIEDGDEFFIQSKIVPTKTLKPSS